MVNKSTAQLITIFSKAGLLKDIKRTGWVVKGIKNAESVADHSWRMSFLVILLAPKNLNRQKLLEMSIVHDLGEIGVGLSADTDEFLLKKISVQTNLRPFSSCLKTMEILRLSTFCANLTNKKPRKRSLLNK